MDFRLISVCSYGAPNGTWSFWSQNQLCVHKIEFRHNKIILSYKTMLHRLVLWSLHFVMTKFIFFLDKKQFCVTKVNSMSQQSIMCHKIQFCETSLFCVIKVNFVRKLVYRILYDFLRRPFIGYTCSNRGSRRFLITSSKGISYGWCAILQK